MQTSKPTERTNIIQIKNKISTQNEINSPKSEYSNKQNLIDPSKSSPPNNFMNKLQKRIEMYSTIFYADNMDDSFDSE
jgi:hypothetical protein